MIEYLDDVWADCLHYFGKDLYELDGASAMKLAERLRWVVDVYPLRHDAEGQVVGDPIYRSSLFAAIERDREEERENATVDVELDAAALEAELRRMDPAGTVEVVSV